MAARRAQQAKQSLASNSNLSTLASTATPLQANNTKTRLKSTSMTNLVGGSASSSSNQTATRIQRPASRNALDSIHKGMNAKFTHVQSKVLLQNIRPQQQQQQVSKIPAKPERLTPTTPSSTLRRSTPQPTTTGGKIQLSDRSQLINKIKALQEDVERHERQRDELKQELERERADKTEQVQQIKFELQERVAESERQNEEYHQKLLEAYELADQNRRAADSVLSESRQREEELRKKIDELEQQLAELKEFVAMKEEMMGKMSEMRDQIRAERERYDEKTRSLHQMFENEKLRLEMELMEKVKQVGESYELNKLKTQNRTIELDARLASERLFATKIRLHQMNNDNEKLNKQLRLAQQHMRDQEKKLLLTETMLRQFVDNGSTMAARLDGGGGATNNSSNNNNRGNSGSNSANLNGGSAGLAANFGGRPDGGVFAFGTRKSRLTGPAPMTRGGGGKLKATASRQTHHNRLVRFGGGGVGAARQRVKPLGASTPNIDRADARATLERTGRGASLERLRRRPAEQLADGEELAGQLRQPVVVVSGAAANAAPGSESSGRSVAAAAGQQQVRNDAGSQPLAAAAVATQTSRPSRARTIINDLRQRLNLGSNSSGRTSGKGLEQGDANWQQDSAEHGRSDAASQAGNQLVSDDDDDNSNDDRFIGESESVSYGHQDDNDTDDDEGQLIDDEPLLSRRLTRRRRSISLDAFLNNSIIRDVGGERLIISRGWPPAAMRRRQHGQQQRRRSAELERGSRGAGKGQRNGHHRYNHRHHAHHHQHNRRRALSERRTGNGGGGLDDHRRRGSTVIQTIVRKPSDTDHENSSEDLPGWSEPAGGRRRHSTINELQKRRLLIEYLRHNPSGDAAAAATGAGGLAPGQPSAAARPRRLSIVQRGQSPSKLIVQYDLPAHKSSSPIVLGGPQAKQEQKTN